MPTELRSAYVFYQTNPTEGLRQTALRKYLVGAWQVFSKYADYVVKTIPVDPKTLEKFRDFGNHQTTGIIGKTYVGKSKEKLISINHIWFRDSNLYEEAIRIVLKKPYVREISYPVFGAVEHDGLIGEITLPPDARGNVPKKIDDLFAIVEGYEENFWKLGQAFPTNFTIEKELEL